MPRPELVLRDGRRLPWSCLEVAFARSGGAGGQHVNKTESKVDLRLDLGAAEAVLGAGDTARIRAALAGRLDAEGRLVVIASEHKSQHQNLAAALARLAALLATALARRKRRIATRPTRGSRHRRLEDKRRRGDLKRGRQGEAD